MTRLVLAAIVMLTAPFALSSSAEAQPLGEVFRRVNPSVVVIRGAFTMTVLRLGRVVKLKGRHP